MERKRKRRPVIRDTETKQTMYAKYPWRNPFKTDTEIVTAKLSPKGLGLFFGAKFKF